MYVVVIKMVITGGKDVKKLRGPAWLYRNSVIVIRYGM